MPPNYSSARTDNASLVTSIQYKETIPFSQSVDYPIYMSSFSNHIGGASSSINHQFDASNPQFFIDSFSKPFKSNFWKNEHNDPNLTYPVLVRNSSLPGYHMADFSLWNFNTNKFPSPIEPNVVDTQINFVGSNNSYSYNVDQIYEKVKNHYRDEVQEKIPMMNPPKRPNINFGPLVNHGIEMLQKKEAWFSTKETKLKAVEAIFGKDEGKNASTSKSANFIKEQEYPYNSNNIDSSLRGFIRVGHNRPRILATFAISPVRVISTSLMIVSDPSVNSMFIVESTLHEFASTTPPDIFP
ncbi:hypothetical protein JHK87_023852 [Glycine soja]|nr:hypothetical protein JHK87_023852 [Glycine soja]